MQQRRLGHTGPMVGAIGLGCWSFAGSYGPTDETQSHRTLAAARELGIDFLDTSNVYGAGVSETVIGNFIKQDRSGEPAAGFKIATKVGIRRDPETGNREFCNTPEHIRAELEDSLQRLQIDQVDLYYIHRRQADIPIEDVAGTLLELQNEGKIAGFGFSEIAPSSLRRAHEIAPVMAVQNEYSLWTRTPELGLIQATQELGTSFVPFSPLARGMLAANLPDPTQFPKSDFRYQSPRFVAPNFAVNCAYFAKFQEYAQELGTTSIVLGLAWILAKGEHVIPIPGTRTTEHLRECAKAADFGMTDEIMAKIEKILPAGFAHGERYRAVQWPGIEQYC